MAHETAIEKSTWFYLSNNCCMGILYNLRRISEICKEHVENNFLPLPQAYVGEFREICSRVEILFNDTLAMMDTGGTEAIPMLRRHCDEIKDLISETYHRLYDQLREGRFGLNDSALRVYEHASGNSGMVSGLRKYLRAYAKLRDTQFRSHPTGEDRHQPLPA